MSIKDMFAIAKSYGDPVTNGLNQFKDYLSVENALNKNWQDALTFGNNTAAINAHNALSAYTDQEKKRKAQGEVAALESYAPFLFNATTGTYNPEHLAAQQAAKAVQITNNPYAITANYQQYQNSAANAANQIAAIDPAQAIALRNKALGNMGITATQNKDGTLSVTNSQGYTRYLDNPNIGAMFGTSADKTAQTLAGWERDDQVSTRDYTEQLGLNADQAKHNLTNNELSLKLQHQLNSERDKSQADLKLDALAKDYELQQQYGIGKAGSKSSDGMKQYYETYYKVLDALKDRIDDPTQLHNMAEKIAKNAHGLDAATANTAADPAAQEKIIADKMAQNGSASKPTTAAATPPELGSSTFAGTRIGSYQLPPRADTRQAEINQLNAYIAQMQAKYDQNAQINPNSYYSQQQLKAINQAKAQLARVQAETDRAYHNRQNPLDSAWNWVFYGDSMPQQGIK